MQFSLQFVFFVVYRFRSEKPQSRGRRNEARSRDQQVPEFVLKMYKSVETGNRKLSVGNTVRCMPGQFSMFITMKSLVESRSLYLQYAVYECWSKINIETFTLSILTT